MAIIKKLKDFMDTRSFLSKNKTFAQYDRSRRTFLSFLKSGWKMKDNYIYKFNKYLNGDLKIKDNNKDLIFCIEDIPWKNTWNMENIYEILHTMGSAYEFENPFKKLVCGLLNKHWVDHTGDLSQADDESDSDVYHREKISKELFDIFIDYKLYSFDNGFTFLKFGKSGYEYERKQISGKQMSNNPDFDTDNIIIGVQVSFTDEITDEDIEVVKNRLLSIDGNLKFNSENYSTDSYKLISKFAFYYEFASIKELSDYLIKLGLIK